MCFNRFRTDTILVISVIPNFRYYRCCFKWRVTVCNNYVRIFFIAYLFMGINFVMMSYFQSISQIRMATWITASREIIFMMIFILILPQFLGVNGVWLSIPLAELIVMVTVLIYIRKNPDFSWLFRRNN
ncbi:polysaccharide biosynthesis C-terminal domain-containing protein [Aliicoccus persicus]|uniref:polysaccharide biosynthesis C-terminal domain-containing protein n=1 Tax=Aliicoccus persicus TaxID=930138 RepID=UPI003182D30B